MEGIDISISKYIKKLKKKGYWVTRPIKFNNRIEIILGSVYVFERIIIYYDKDINKLLYSNVSKYKHNKEKMVFQKYFMNII
jgi:hypothetical protein